MLGRFPFVDDGYGRPRDARQSLDGLIALLCFIKAQRDIGGVRLPRELGIRPALSVRRREGVKVYHGLTQVGGEVQMLPRATKLNACRRAAAALSGVAN